MKYQGPVVLIIIDGYGLSQDTVGNAVMAAHSETLWNLRDNYPWVKLKASGTAVGLPSDEDMGNSEVGHNAIGAGRIYQQGAAIIDQAFATGSIWQGEVWKSEIKNVLDNNSTLHLIGLLSDGGVHSNISHLFALIDQAKNEGVKKVRVHILLDGRDVAPTSALEYVGELEKVLALARNGGFDYQIADGGGRQSITMDRYGANWAMVGKGWRTHVLGEGRQFVSAAEAIEAYREEKTGIIDQDLPPFVIAEKGKPVGKIVDGDSVILFNFRGDRAQELALAFETGADFDKFDRVFVPKVEFASLLEYDSEKHIPKRFLIAPPVFTNTLGEIIAKDDLRQLAISETQKFGHVTYFFNGNRANKFNESLETYLEVPSDIVPFEQRPWMKSAEIADKLIDEITKKHYDFVRVNFPNPDVVGHTGNFEATIEGIEAVDEALSRILPVIDDLGGMAIVTADHGNAEKMFAINENGQKVTVTSHTTNLVPCYFYDNTENAAKYIVEQGECSGLTNIAATVADLLDIKSDEKWRKSLVKTR
ncbi:MAG: 2,3-bisphosphoglycerate-independent phosphoglycerate mutase [Candidatus Nomurabacteria bacterium]|jgi:2,3-bisphosphoglycerate-independent phosphoglycerate mutase|nr:2,3-bisphosphoglycerate-independent phosphoglycerate mutase [Candidatus Nomurabacteria bacterium]